MLAAAAATEAGRADCASPGSLSVLSVGYFESCLMPVNPPPYR